MSIGDNLEAKGDLSWSSVVEEKQPFLRRMIPEQIELVIKGEL